MLENALRNLQFMDWNHSKIYAKKKAREQNIALGEGTKSRECEKGESRLNAFFVDEMEGHHPRY